MSGISTHVLDVSTGKPAVNVRVRLYRADTEIGSTVTSEDGRCPALLPSGTALLPGVHRLTFEIGSYFEDGFYPEVTVCFQVRDAAAHYHVPLLISPYGYTTYRGS
jgi:5-hydroxyisourate hydrolase